MPQLFYLENEFEYVSAHLHTLACIRPVCSFQTLIQKFHTSIHRGLTKHAAKCGLHLEGMRRNPRFYFHGSIFAGSDACGLPPWKVVLEIFSFEKFSSKKTVDSFENIFQWYDGTRYLFAISSPAGQNNDQPAGQTGWLAGWPCCFVVRTCFI